LFFMESFARLSFVAIIVAAAVYDLRERRIPNFLTVAATVLALAAHCWAGGYDGLTIWFWGLLAGAGLLMIPFAMGGMGAGDVKLLACAGSMLGATQVFYVFVASSLLGALLALPALAARMQKAREAGAPARHIPYGLPLAVGVLLGAAGAWLK